MASPSPLPETKENKRPIINIPDYPVNEGPLTKLQKIPGFVKNKRPIVNSGNLGGFPNAKAASMLERGFVKKLITEYLMKGTPGLLVFYDGPEFDVTVEKCVRVKKDTLVCTFKDASGTLHELPVNNAKQWSFYGRTTPVPFVPNPRNKRKTRRKQKGGFYPSVYGGVCGAKILAPLVARQMMRMYETHSKRKTKRRSKKLSHKKRG